MPAQDGGERERDREKGGEEGSERERQKEKRHPCVKKTDLLQKALWAKPKNTHTSTPDSLNTLPALTFDNALALQLLPWDKDGVEILGESKSAWIRRRISSTPLRKDEWKRKSRAEQLAQTYHLIFLRQGPRFTLEFKKKFFYTYFIYIRLLLQVPYIPAELTFASCLAKDTAAAL